MTQHRPPHSDPDPDDADRAETLARRMVFWRRRLDPTTLPRPSGTAQKSPPSQEELARLSGMSARWYHNLERGNPNLRNYADDTLDRVAYALRLSEAERQFFFLHAVKREAPPLRTRPDAGINDVVRQLVDGVPWPAYISDPAWDFVAHNELLAEWFPWVKYDINIMWWTFTFAEARDQLHDWESVWAPRMLSQMRMVRALQPDNERLNAVVTEILKVDEFARRLWDSDLGVYANPDGDRRQLRLPHHDNKLVTVEIIALELFRSPGARFIVLMPVDDD